MDIILLISGFIFIKITGRSGCYEGPAGLLMICGILLFLYYVRKYRDILVPPAVFSLSWVFCIGIACLKLSRLQNEWCAETWHVLFNVFFLFILFFRATYLVYGRSGLKLKTHEISSRELLPVILIFTAVSYVSFFTEALILGFIPLFTEATPHAYSTFHISGVHYFTVLCVLVPFFSVLYFHKTTDKKNRRKVMICAFFCLILPVLMVSRFQLIFSILLAGTAWLILNGSSLRKYVTAKNIIIVLCMVLVMAGLYVFITVERAHSIEYLNSIFEMKDTETPIYITQPYIYIANNFENFDCLVKELPEHTNGLRSAYPLFALTGLKFLHPELVSFPLYTTKEELTTLTLIYDVYYDFGSAGCSIFASALGIVYGLFYRIVKERKNDLILLIYIQMTVYLILAFFTTWYSNPTTWFYMGICVFTDIILVMVRFKTKQSQKRKKGNNGI